MPSPCSPFPSSPAVLQAVQRINRAIQRGVAADTVKELMCPEAQLPPVYPFASAVYQQELAVLQRQQQGVSPRNDGLALGFLSSWRIRAVSPEHPLRVLLDAGKRLGERGGLPSLPP